MRRRDPPSGAPRLLLLLPVALTLPVAGALAWSALDARRSHRATAERTVQDWAAFAATIAGANARASLEPVLLYAFYAADLAERQGSAAPVAPGRLAENPPEAGRCASAYPGGRWFARVGGDGELDAVGPLEPALALWLGDTLGTLLDAPSPGAPHGNLFPIVEGRRRVIAYRLRRSEGRPLEAHALAHCFSDGAGPVFAQARQRTPLLPPSLVGTAPVDSLLTLTVTDPGGAPVYRSPAVWTSPYVGVRAPDPAGPLAGLTLTVTLRPELADRLVAGGIPPSRVPLTLLLLVLAAALVVATGAGLRRAVELGRLRARFVADVSHELRTPLQEILLFVQLLRMGGGRDDAERVSWLGVVERETLRLIALVERVLTFSRPAASGPPPDAADVEAVVEETVEAFRPLAAAGGATVVTALAPGTPPVRADAASLRQVLLNLLDNAVKFGPAGQRIDVATRAVDGRVLLSVRDQGPGIAAGDREEVWKPFRRLERDGGGPAGSGIGLAVVRELVEALGGTAALEDAPGGGTLVVVSLPAVR